VDGNSQEGTTGMRHSPPKTSSGRRISISLATSLHDVGCGRDRAGDRKLGVDQYNMLKLLYISSPVVSSTAGPVSNLSLLEPV
jgi:hypothetical protein